jgi:D-methionine transport system substrate-binding protein
MSILSAKTLAGRVGAALIGVAAIALAGAASAETIRIGVSAGPHAQILDAVKPIAAKQGLDIKVIEFTDYVIPNAALASGEIEANSFQHQPYLDNQVQDRGLKLVSVGKTVVFPMGIYSKKVKNLS